jgi:hypothetical protein
MKDLPLLKALATSFLAGEPAVEQIVGRSARTLGRKWRWLRPLAKRYLDAMAGRPRPRHREVVAFLILDAGFRRVRENHSHELAIATWLREAPQMHPVAAAETWNVPSITTVADLAKWFGIEIGELEWLADLKALTYRDRSSKLRHYHYKILVKPSGGARLIEAPKPKLKNLQRQILAQILEKIPPHPAAHGFVKRRSIKTFVAPHIGQDVVLRMDLQDFFPSFPAARIQTFFRTLGYPEPVADLLGGICTNAVPRDIWKSAADLDPSYLAEARIFYSKPHLPQGAPTSPALANLCSYRIDCRLMGLADSVGASYSRYADDLAFSGGTELHRRVEHFSTHVAAILLEEGFNVCFRKTRIMRQGVRQHLAGIVTNEHPNVMRTDFDRLKAILTNCVRSGPESQNRDSHADFRSHLEGRVGFVEMINPEKGKRLRRLLGQVRWPE